MTNRFTFLIGVWLLAVQVSASTTAGWRKPHRAPFDRALRLLGITPGSPVCGGRLILCHYRNLDGSYVDPGLIAQNAGLIVVGQAEVPGTAIAWGRRSSV